MGTRNQSNKDWADWEDNLLRDYATQHLGYKRLAMRLRRSEDAVTRRGQQLGYTKPTRTTKAAMMARLDGCSPNHIQLISVVNIGNVI